MRVLVQSVNKVPTYLPTYLCVCLSKSPPAEAAKHRKHAAAAAAAGMRYLTCALTTYSGWGEEFLKAHVRPEYQRRLKDDKKAGGNGWEPRRWLQRLYEAMSISIARSNRSMLNERLAPAGVA
jgi:hypothetical protein